MFRQMHDSPVYLYLYLLAFSLKTRLVIGSYIDRLYEDSCNVHYSSPLSYVIRRA